MHRSSISHHASDRPLGPVLLVSDWDVDPQAVVDAAHERHPTAGVYLLVPARLRGLDWLGDPYASVPCAQHQLDAIVRVAAAAGLDIVDARVGDPEPIAAIGDALADWPARQLMLCAEHGRKAAPHPFDLPLRARRLSGLPVARIELPPATSARERRHLLRLGAQCAIEQPQAA